LGGLQEENATDSAERAASQRAVNAIVSSRQRSGTNCSSPAKPTFPATLIFGDFQHIHAIETAKPMGFDNRDRRKSTLSGLSL
jgi:hypothetical protein